MISCRKCRRAASLAIAAGAGALLAAPAVSQVPQASAADQLDPSAPLDPLPGLGVDWPEMDKSEPVADLPTASGTPAADVPARPVGEVEDGIAALRYRVTLAGVDGALDSEALEGFARQSALEQGSGKPANAAQIDRRARGDAELLSELLRAEGFFDAVVEPRIEAVEANESETGLVAVFLDAAPGSQYRFASVELPGIEAAGEDSAQLRESFAVEAGEPVVAAEVIAAGIALKIALGERGFALAEVGEQDIVVDHEARTARLVLPVTPGPVASFGAIRVTGSPPFDARHVGLIARFERGERFRQSRVDDLRRALVATGLVSSAEVRVTPAAGGRTVDLAVHLEPAPMRTVAGELGYGTGEGLRAEASWQHRNFFNPEGALTVRGVAGTQEQVAAVSLRRSNFRRRDQVALAQVSASNVDRDAYAARTLLLSAGIERQSNFIWHKKWTWSLGSELVFSDERDTVASTGLSRRRQFYIAAIPASLGYDGSDDLLDPTRGFRLSGRVSPEVSWQGGAFGYGRAQIDASLYRAVSKRVVAAGRIRLGTIVGARRDMIAPSRRFYSGGGGSVRGYG